MTGFRRASTCPPVKSMRRLRLASSASEIDGHRSGLRWCSDIDAVRSDIEAVRAAAGL